MFTHNRLLSPTEYAKLYNLSATKAAVDIGITENTFRRYTLSTKSRLTPDNKTLRIVQLLHFIKEQGLTPPDF